MTLRQSVRYRRYSWYLSKIKRKPWALRKRLGLWQNYFVILGMWGLHYKKYQQLVKSIFLWNSFMYNFVFVNPQHYSNTTKTNLNYLYLFHSYSITKNFLSIFKVKYYYWYSSFCLINYINRAQFLIYEDNEFEFQKDIITNSKSYSIYNHLFYFYENKKDLSQINNQIKSRTIILKLIDLLLIQYLNKIVMIYFLWYRLLLHKIYNN